MGRRPVERNSLNIVRVCRHFGVHDTEGRLCALYSTALHPRHRWLATGGADAHVRIWNLSSVLSTWLADIAQSEAVLQQRGTHSRALSRASSSGKAALLATLSKHAKSVNAVKWSHTGSFLASGSDDTQVIVWNQNSKHATEWIRLSTLRGHDMDVLDLAWSPDDAFLASCSFDNSVLIWGMRDLGAVTVPQRKLTGHTTWVKGLAWDPIGHYLASVAEDKRVIIWRAFDNWAIEAEVTVPFKHGSMQALYCRLSWSPDGMHLGVPNACKSKQQTAAIISREYWHNSQADLVGHRHPVTVVRFAPIMFDASESETCNSSRSHPLSAVALGSQDGTISVWTSLSDRPFLVLKNCFSGAVSDMCWSSDGLQLVGCSHDGSICALDFLSNGCMRVVQHQSTKETVCVNCLNAVGTAGQTSLPTKAASTTPISRSLPLVCLTEAASLTAISRSLPLKLSSTTHLVTTRVNVTETGVSPEVQQDQVESVVHRCMNMHSVAEQSVRALHHPEIERVNLHKAANELLPMPKLNEFLSVNIAALSHPSLYLEGKVIKTICILAHNPLPKTSASAHRRPATIVASAHGVCVWQSTVDGVVTALAGCEKCCIVGTQNGSLHLYDLLSGNVAAPCWMLSGAICYLALTTLC
mmetsp:Transcript_8658/g.35649  ORF Transcript_8658/g.35649 Transcript_8658/m.35649 type:complete len:640 (-) Transcript_8658:969-2888(-)